MTAKVYLGPAARQSTQHPDRLMRKAEAVAAGISLPAGIEFARFEHQGRTYAISSRVAVEVELLTSRVPNVVIRSGKSGQEKR
ncbi:MAG: hypothetical protein Q8Q62_02475 [Mesorhizobium sp.]|nr:hypothetical protein [Mesorhizobium sp.]